MYALTDFIEEAIVAMFKGQIPGVQLRRMARWVATAVAIRFSEYACVERREDNDYPYVDEGDDVL